MAILLVTYDLKQPGRNYQPLYEYFSQFNRCHGLESVWLIETNKTCVRVRDDLTQLIDKNDVTYVQRISTDWAAFGFECGNWLNDANRIW